METFRFASPEMLWLLLLLPIVALWLGRRGQSAAVQYSSVETLKQLGAARRSHAGAWLTFFRMLALAGIVVALARPQIGESRSEVEASGIDMMLVIDVSGSMRALDFRMGGDPADRLAVVKDVVAKFIKERPNDRIGIVAFATYPYLISPPTLDHDFLLQNLERVQIDMRNADTAIGSGLASGLNRLRDTAGKSKVIVLLTDGSNNSGKITPQTAAEAARALGIKVYTIGAGSEGPVPVPEPGPGGMKRIVLAEMPIDEETLQKIASETGGRYFRATDTASLERVYKEIDQMEKTTAKQRKYEMYHEQFAWAVLPVLLLLGSEVGLRNTWLRRLP